MDTLTDHLDDYSRDLIDELADKVKAPAESHAEQPVMKALDDYLNAVSGAVDRLTEKNAQIRSRVVNFFEEHRAPGNSAANGFIPQYNYWPLDQISHDPPENTTFCFSDGGCFDNTGILGLLARTDADRIIAFVNSQTPLERDQNSQEIIVDGQLPLLFGYQPDCRDGKYVTYGGMSPDQPLSYVQVFSDAQGDFAALRSGLYAASCGGPNLDNNLGTYTAAFTQLLTTVENPVARIEGGRQVKVLWVYSNRVNAWQNAIRDTNIQKDLEQGQANQHEKGVFLNGRQADDPKSQDMECDFLNWGPLFNFPYYSTFLQICLNKEAVNMLAQLSAWNVQQLEGAIFSLLK